MSRNTYQQSVVGKSGEAADQGGHLIASALGGAGDKINLVPMDKILNNGSWKTMETSLGKALEQGKSVSVKIDVGYPASGGNRPSEFRVEAKINGNIVEFPVFKQQDIFMNILNNFLNSISKILLDSVKNEFILIELKTEIHNDNCGGFYKFSTKSI